jgi:hypothetical protein
MKKGYTITEVVEITGLGRTAIYEAINDKGQEKDQDKRLRAKKWGRRTIVLAEDLEKFLKNLPDA